LSKKITRGTIKPAKYLPIKVIDLAKSLSRALYTSKTIEEVISIEKQLNALIRKAVMIRSAKEYADILTDMSKEELMSYLQKNKE
jgi:hypothetical protein